MPARRSVLVSLMLLCCLMLPGRAFAQLTANLVSEAANTVTVALTNRGEAPVSVWVPGSVLDPALVENAFWVQGPVNGAQPVSTVAYTGTHAKRVAPQWRDVVTLEPGETVRRDLDVSTLYRVPVAGVYRVALRQVLHTIDPRVRRADTLTRAAFRHVVLSSDGVDVQFDVPTASARLRTPSFNRCTVNQRSSIELAARSAELYANRAHADLLSLDDRHRSASPRYARWFGAYSDARFDAVVQQFANIRRVLNGAALGYDCTCDVDGVYAYVYVDEPYNLFICPAFWNAPNTGTDSKAGTLVHELSHFRVIAGTDDHVYGQADAAQLAQVSPFRAVNNADNHEYFAENLPAVAIASSSVTPPTGTAFQSHGADASVDVSVAADDAIAFRIAPSTRVTLRAAGGQVRFDVYADERLSYRLCTGVVNAARAMTCAPGTATTLYARIVAQTDSVLRLTTETANVGASLPALTQNASTAGTVAGLDTDRYRVSGANTVQLTIERGAAELVVLRDPDDPSSVLCTATGGGNVHTCTFPDPYIALFPTVVGQAETAYRLAASNQAVLPANTSSQTPGSGLGAMGLTAVLLLVRRLRRRTAVAGLVAVFAVSVGGCVHTHAGQSGSPQNGLVVTLAPHASGGHVLVRVENTQNTTVTLPVWGTPFESPILGDYFAVQRGEQAAAYRGPLAKRRWADSPVRALAAGDRFDAVIDLTSLYDMSRPGHYTVSLWMDRLLARWSGVVTGQDRSSETVVRLTID